MVPTDHKYKRLFIYLFTAALYLKSLMKILGLE